MLAAAVDRTVMIPCTADTVRPQLTVSNAIFDQAHVHVLPGLTRVSEPEPGLFRTGLSDEAWDCFMEGVLPSERGLSWACAPDRIALAGYTAFSGERFEKGGFAE